MSTAQNAVTAEPGNSSGTIRARVGDSAIDKVTRLKAYPSASGNAI